MTNVLELGLNDLFAGARIGESFMDWFKGFKKLAENEKAKTVENLVDDARKNLDIFNSCNAVYFEDGIKVIINEIPEVAQGMSFTNGDTIKNIEYLDFISTLCWCSTEGIDVGYMNCQAYLDFNEETDGEDYWDNHYKVANSENSKYEILETIAGMSFEDMEKHFISFQEEDLGQGRYFLKLDNGIEIVVDKLD